MAQNFIACDREQALLLPPSLREWLPEGHLGWFVLDAVAELDLGAFYAGYRDDGHGRAAHDPAMMVALFVYAYAIGVRSSRAIERRCHDDVAFRVITAHRAPDHATIARFRVRHEAAIAGLAQGPVTPDRPVQAAEGARVPSVRIQRREPGPTPGRLPAFDVAYSRVALSPLECQSVISGPI